ncbi:MAG: tRNA 2-selenouridine(34) synthase MnmH [Saprospiraceae bacterium]|nr:tRNA 2-selenouridine(34) synthase MnmH [Saprospiraceae bacterium]
MAGVDAFLKLKETLPVLDVRAPKEFIQGHIPGAISFPLFNDVERAEVGTCYKQKGKEKAFELGLRIVGPKMEGFVQQARAHAHGGKILVHCWRGGQRSGSMAWLLKQAGLEVETLAGGYKAYRNHVLGTFKECPVRLIVLGGQTGTGKTKILKSLQKKGEQIIDLEAIACHKGSAFGFIGEPEQPTVEQFENELFEVISQLDDTKNVWVENESRSIGRVFIPDDFWAKMKSATLVNVEIPPEARIANLLEDYVQTNKELLELAFRKIEKKLGGLALKQALEYLEQNDYAAAARIALNYYDKTYQHNLDVNTAPDIRMYTFDSFEPDTIAGCLSDQFPG